MNPDVVSMLRCPGCGALLGLEGDVSRAPDGHVSRGSLTCAGCASCYPIQNGVAAFVEPSCGSYVRSFGRQWTRYEVQQHREDEETFEVKTGVALSDLAGLDVLDAGCGGGRYTSVAARHGARVIGVDLSEAVEQAVRLCASLPGASVLRADLMHLPLATGRFDLVFSIGVLHHCPDAHAAFAHVARRVRPGGRLAVWLYRENTALQEAVNTVLRGVTTRMPMPRLEPWCEAAAMVGAVPGLGAVLSKLVNFSHHPVWINRVCDTFDWWSPRYQSHHTPEQVRRWFVEEGFDDVRELPPARTSRVYAWAYRHNLIVGSGVNVVGRKRRASTG